MRRPHYLYRLYDSRGGLLYIGITANLSARMASHKCERPWWELVDTTRTRVTEFPDRDSVLLAEVAAIAAELPPMNRNRGGGGSMGGALSPKDATLLLSRQADARAARDEYKSLAVAALAITSIREVARITGLSTNTLQKWKRET